MDPFYLLWYGRATEQALPYSPYHPAPQYQPPSTSLSMPDKTLYRDIDSSVSSYSGLASPESFSHGPEQPSSSDNTHGRNHLSLLQEPEDKARSIFPTGTMAATTSTGQDILPGSHPEHITSWYLTCWKAIVVNGPRMFVPQVIYEPRSPGDKDRYVSRVRLQPPIIFLTEGSHEWGIPISQLLSKHPIHVVGGDEPAFASCGPSIGIRVNWPGYRPFHKQVQTRDYTPERRPITKARLAQIVARGVEQYMDDMYKQVMEVGSDRRWRVGSSGIQAEDIILISLHQVSKGSWQPQLRLRRIVRAE